MRSRKTVKGKKIKKNTPCGSLIHATAAMAILSVRHLMQNENQRLLFPEKLWLKKNNLPRVADFPSLWQKDVILFFH